MLIFYFALIKFYNYDEFLQISKIIMKRTIPLLDFYICNKKNN